MRFGPHWSGYPPDDPPQCDHRGDYCECEPPEDIEESQNTEEDNNLRRLENETITETLDK